jgi:aldehyde:ferredoxin oxidoreductase
VYGWTGKLLRVNLTERRLSEISTLDYTDRFIGGKGIGEKIYWDEYKTGLDSYHPESPLILMTGPLAATAAPSGSRWLICGKSPSLYPENFASANLGAFFGAALKQAGFDGLVIQGKASEKVYLSIDNREVTIKDASHLWGLTTDNTMQTIRKELEEEVKILTTGIAGENAVRFSTISTDVGGSGSMGFGSVMGSKNLKAIAVKGTAKIPVANADALKYLRQKIRAMTGEGYFNLYGTPPPLPDTEVIKQVRCHGCPQGCWRSLYKATSGEEGIRKCQSTFFYNPWDAKRHGQTTKVSFHATALANAYSLCSMELAGIIWWLEECFNNRILSENETELPLNEIGSLSFVETIISKISKRAGFGNILAEGVMRAAEQVGKEAQEIALDHFTQTGRGIAYGPKVFSPSALIYATEPRPTTPELHEIFAPLTKWALWYTTQGTYSYVSTAVLKQIAKRFWGSEAAINFSNYVDKALTAVKIQDRQYAKECLILCDFVYPIFDDASCEDHTGDPTLENQLFTAVTGKEMDESELLRAGARVFNLFRAILLREGRNGRKDDYLPESQFIERVEPLYDAFGMFNPDMYLPGSGDEVFSQKGKALPRDTFERMLDEYYELRGWDVATGFFTKKNLKDLNLTELIEPLSGKVIS